MTLLMQEGFEALAEGAIGSSRNTAFASFSGTATFTSAAALFGSRGCLFLGNGSNFGQYNFGATIAAVYARWYMKIDVAPDATAGQVILAHTLLSTTARAQVTIGPASGVINLRQGASLRASTVGDYAGQWLRCEWSMVDTTQTLALYAGTNLHGATPTETLTAPITAGGFDRFRLGFAGVTGNTNGYRLDGVALDNAAMPAPLTPDAVPVGKSAYLWDGAAWVGPKVIDVWDGAAWQRKTSLTIY